MKLLVRFLMLVVVVSVSVWAQQPIALTEVQRLKADNLRLQFALLQQQESQLREAAQKLEAQRIALEGEFREALKPEKESTWNWSTLQFEARKTPPQP